jgi:hypothetical protein
MTTHAICLLMTGYAALQILPGSERVAEKSEALFVMKSGEERAALVEPKVQVAFTAKSLGVMAAAAVADPTVSLGSVGGEEVDWVELRRSQAIVALSASVLRMAAVAVRLAG